MLKYKISQLQLQLHWLTVINIEIVISPCVVNVSMFRSIDFCIVNLSVLFVLMYDYSGSCSLKALLP